MQLEREKMEINYLDILGHRIDVVRATRQKSRSKWAYDYWGLVERQLMRKLSDLSKQYTL